MVPGVARALRRRRGSRGSGVKHASPTARAWQRAAAHLDLQGKGGAAFCPRDSLSWLRGGAYPPPNYNNKTNRGTR